MAIDSLDAAIWLAISAVSAIASAVVATWIARRRAREATERALAEARGVEARVMVDGGRLTAADEPFARLVGRPSAEILGRPLSAFIEGFDIAAAHAAESRPVEAVLCAGANPGRKITISAARLDGREDTRVLYLHSHGDSAVMEKQVAFLSRHDALTGLANLSSFVEESAGRLIAAEPHGRRIALAEIDLVRFRAINDVMGRRFGDRALTEVARRLQEAATAETLIGRLGGDRFLAALPVVGTASAVAHDVGRLMQAATGPVETPEGLVEVTARAAVTVLDPPLLGASPEDDVLLAQTMVEQGMGLVELAMARAKRDPSPRVVVYDPAEDQPRRERGALALALPRALAIVDKVFAVHYQPQVRLWNAALGADGQPMRRASDRREPPADRPFGPVVGYEALLRCSLPGRGPVGPAELIPVAEETNAILPLGEWALRRACADAAKWRGGQRVAVNLSPVQLRHDGVVGMVASAIRRSGIDPARLELEITETAMIDDLDRAVAVLTALRQLEVALAIDDFGAGFTSLRTLKAFRFDKIKLDRAFVTDIARDPQTAAIARSVVALGVELRTPILAEGVETLAALRALDEIGCAEAQGYLIGRPAPLEALPDLDAAETAADLAFLAVEAERRESASADEEIAAQPRSAVGG